MRRWRLWRYLGPTLLAAIVAVVAVNSGVSIASAETSNSAHYQVTQTQFGSDSTAESCSTQYCAQAGISSAAGSTSNTANTATFGSVTNSNPRLEVIIEDGESDLGVLNTEHTATKTTTVQVLNYLSSGYVLQIIGDAPTYDGHSLKTLTTPTASKPGTEQFGINAAANTSPAIGADPVQVPSSQTSFGLVNDDYKTPNLFQYVSGDVVAHSSTASGQTNYTISMILNVSNNTPAGRYSGDFSTVVIPVY